MSHSKLPGTYELRSLASDPRYHVLIEHDPEKSFVTPVEKPASNYQSSFLDSAENAAKRHRYQEFLDSLGPDPRPLETTRLSERPAALLGHANGDITTHYSAAEFNELKKAVDKIVDQSVAQTPTLMVVHRTHNTVGKVSENEKGPASVAR